MRGGGKRGGKREGRGIGRERKGGEGKGGGEERGSSPPTLSHGINPIAIAIKRIITCS